MDPILRSPTTLEPLRVMVIGDSVTYEIQPGLTAALQHTGLVVSANRTLIGFGLSQWPIFRWWEAQYAFLVGVALDVLTADGAHVYWMTMLLSPEAGQSERLNRLLADLTPGFTNPEGHYIQQVDRHGAVWPILRAGRATVMP